MSGLGSGMIHICEAGEFGHLTACGRCALTWDTNAKDRPPCKPKADPPIGLNEMIEAMREEGLRIHASQRAAMGSPPGWRSEPHMGELRKSSVFFATANLLERVRDDKQVSEKLKGGGQ